MLAALPISRTTRPAIQDARDPRRSEDRRWSTASCVGADRPDRPGAGRTVDSPSRSWSSAGSSAPRSLVCRVATPTLGDRRGRDRIARMALAIEHQLQLHPLTPAPPSTADPSPGVGGRPMPDRNLRRKARDPGRRTYHGR